MRLLISMIMISFLSACSTGNYHYQSMNNPQKWEGQNIAAVQKQWGSADQEFHMDSGISYYLYSTSSGANFFNSTSTNFGLAETSNDFPLRGQDGLECSAIFKTNNKGVIISTSHVGNNCGGQWVANS